MFGNPLRFGVVAIFFLVSTAAFAEEKWDHVIANYCLDCHDGNSEKGGINMELWLDGDFVDHAGNWERVLRQLDARQMPPVGENRPDEATYTSLVAGFESRLDRAAEIRPNPGRTDTLRRLTRFEYQNAIRDLLALEIDATELLPADESSHGFDNITVGTLSPGLLERYLTAAQKISRLATGHSGERIEERTVRLAPDLTQEEHVPGLPLGTRGGAVIPHLFPVDGEYEVHVLLTRDRNELIEGLSREHELQILVNRERQASLRVAPPKNKQDHTTFDARLKARIKVKAGSQDLGVTFVKNPSSVEETLRQPYDAHFNFHRHPRISPAVYQVSITGPFETTGAGDTASRRRVFSYLPEGTDDEIEAARKNLGALMRIAYRRPITEDDFDEIMAFFEEGRKAGNFEDGVELALSAILVSRDFLFKLEKDPEEMAAETPYRINNLELASRLAFFLWSSLPDEELLLLAEQGVLHQSGKLREQVRRMLEDPRSKALVTNFADQWLYLRNLDSITPDGRLFPGFDENLRQAFREETSRHVERLILENMSVLDLLETDDTFLNERLAKHYGVPHIYGTRFRSVDLNPEWKRGGLFRQGSILTVTSYANRTSPVIRGHWILENILGTPPPPPPPNIPALEDAAVSADLPIRERLAAHREKAACASCHNVMDPIGFALENYDAVGQWRAHENGLPVDATGTSPSGAEFEGISGLEGQVLARPELFVRTFTEKLLTYALGRGIEPTDAPAIRRVVRESAETGYAFESVIQSLVTSSPFTMRMSASESH
ncbi:MAG: DUF1592 domain-containing protein [Verrucomicrobiales bacterium]|nr:DUF1592 domain-containing protein [Verrucomicrobiales bacterium]